MQAYHKANEERKSCISETSDVQGHAENLKTKSRDGNNPLTPRRFVLALHYARQAKFYQFTFVFVQKLYLLCLFIISLCIN